MNELPQSPRFVDVENEFATFIRDFRGGIVVRDLVPDAPQMSPNADYFFPEDDVIAELKCLRTDTGDQEHLRARFLHACEKLGYSAEQALRIAFRDEPLPQDVARVVVGASLNHVRKALRKANRQIGATKLALARKDGLGLVILANESNVGLTAEQLFRYVLADLRTAKDQHIDGLIYVTPNLFHPLAERNASLWLPAYRRVVPRLTEFVDAMGEMWGHYLQERDSALLPAHRVHEPPLVDFAVRPAMRAFNSR